MLVPILTVLLDLIISYFSRQIVLLLSLLQVGAVATNLFERSSSPSYFASIGILVVFGVINF